MNSNRHYVVRALGAWVLTVAAAMSTDASAACAQTNLAGTWYATGVTGNSNTNGFEDYIRCKIVLNSAGTVVTSGSSCIGRDSVGRYTVPVTGGRVRASAACAVSGSLTFGGVGLHTIEFGQMDRGAHNIYTVALYRNANPDFLTVLTVVKQ
ncbi:MAG: hypothetical protein HY941_12750 [Gammaproteobacteria bacterium]|nr:hypothetical protein [Gammaproteobacteria bacterium]